MDWFDKGMFLEREKKKGEIIDLFQLLASVSSMTRANTDCDTSQMDRLEPLSTLTISNCYF